MLTQRELTRYFKRLRYGGRSAPARALDYVALRLILLVAAFLFFRLRMDTVHAAILALIALAAATLLLHAAREAAMARFVRAETLRIRRLLVCEQLPYLDPADFLLLCRRACGPGSPAALQRAEPVGADALLPLLRAATGPVSVCSSSGFTPAAEAFVRRAPHRAELIGPAALAAAAKENDPFWPGDEAVHAYIASQCARRAPLRVLVVQAAAGLRAGGAVKKYLLTAAVLLFASCLTRFALYYRMLAGLCITLAAVSVMLSRSSHAKRPD